MNKDNLSNEMYVTNSLTHFILYSNRNSITPKIIGTDMFDGCTLFTKIVVHRKPSANDRLPWAHARESIHIYADVSTLSSWPIISEATSIT